MRLALFLACLPLCLAEDAPKPEPQITVEEQRDWQKLRADSLEAQQRSRDLQKAMEDMTTRLIAKCGGNLVLDPKTGSPVCGPKDPPKEQKQ